jgi:hypothetical protein
MKQEDAARTGFVCYKQLEEILRVLEPQGEKPREIYAAESCARSFNQILSRLRECFAIDPTFLRAIEHLMAISRSEAENAYELWGRVRADTSILLGTARAFLELYLPPEEKKKVVGFQA